MDRLKAGKISLKSTDEEGHDSDGSHSGWSEDDSGAEDGPPSVSIKKAINPTTVKKNNATIESAARGSPEKQAAPIVKSVLNPWWKCPDQYLLLTSNR